MFWAWFTRLLQNPAQHEATTGPCSTRGHNRTLPYTRPQQDPALHQAHTRPQQDPVLHEATTGLCPTRGHNRTLPYTKIQQDTAQHAATTGPCPTTETFVRSMIILTLDYFVCTLCNNISMKNFLAHLVENLTHLMLVFNATPLTYMQDLLLIWKASCLYARPLG